MNKGHYIFSGAIFLIIVIGGFFFWWQLKHLTNNDNNSVGNTNTAAHAAFPDGIVLAGEMTVDTTYDTQALASTKVPLLSDGQPGGTSYSFFSPHHDLFAEPTDVGTKLAVVSVPLGHVFTMTTAPASTVFSWATWSGNSRYLVAGLQLPEDAQPREGTWSSSFMRIDLYTGVTKIILSPADLKKAGATFLVPVAIANDGASAVFSWSENGSNWQYYAWSEKGNTLVRMNIPAEAQVNTMTNATGEDVLWWIAQETVVTQKIGDAAPSIRSLPGMLSNLVFWKPDSDTLAYGVLKGKNYAVMVKTGDGVPVERTQLSYLPDSILWSLDGTSLYLRKIVGGNLTYEKISSNTSSHPTTVDMPAPLFYKPIYGFTSNKDLSATVIHLLARELTVWSTYTPNSDPNVLGDGNCPEQTAAYHALSKAIDAKPRHKLELGGGTPILWTANPTKATDANISTLISDKDVCGVGSWYPIKALSDRLLWTVGCGGMGPDPNAADYLQQNACSVIEPYLDQIVKATK